MEENLHELQNHLKQQKIQIKEYESYYQKSQTSNQLQTEENQVLRQEQIKLYDLNVKLQQQLKEIDSNYEEACKTIIGMEDGYKEAGDQLERIENQLKNSNYRYVQIQKKLEQEQAEKENLNKKIQELQRKADAYDEKVKSFNQTYKMLEKEKSKNQALVEQLKKKEEEIQKINKNIHLQIDSKENERCQQSEQILQLKASVKRVQSEKEMIDEMFQDLTQKFQQMSQNQKSFEDNSSSFKKNTESELDLYRKKVQTQEREKKELKSQLLAFQKRLKDLIQEQQKDQSLNVQLKKLEEQTSMQNYRALQQKCSQLQENLEQQEIANTKLRVDLENAKHLIPILQKKETEISQLKEELFKYKAAHHDVSLRMMEKTNRTPEEFNRSYIERKREEHNFSERSTRQTGNSKGKTRTQSNSMRLTQF